MSLLVVFEYEVDPAGAEAFEAAYGSDGEWARYLRGVAREHGVDRRVRPNTEITACEWEDRSCRWMIASADGRTWDADAVVLATGQLHRPAFPRIGGREAFAGHSFHSSQRDPGYDVAGRRVAVIGRARAPSSSCPRFAKRAARVVAAAHSARLAPGQGPRRPGRPALEAGGPRARFRPQQQAHDDPE